MASRLTPNTRGARVAACPSGEPGCCIRSSGPQPPPLPQARSPHLVEDEVCVLQGLDLLLAARHCLGVVAPSVDAGGLELRELRFGLVLELGVLREILLAVGKDPLGLLLLALLCLDEALLLGDVGLGVGLVLVELRRRVVLLVVRCLD